MTAFEYIYFDHAAATPLSPQVERAMQPFQRDHFFNPSSPYAPALAVRRAYQEAKDVIARAIGAKADELVMTAGATESINLAFGSIDGHVVTSAIEHHAVLRAAEQHGNSTIVPVGKKGVVSVEAIAAAITPATTLVSVALANNELGTVQPLSKLAEIIRKERQRRRDNNDLTPIYLHSDASQGVGQLDVNVARLGVDLLTLNAGKIYGPKQVGLLWAHSGVRLRAQVFGGGQERGLRSGTENVAGVVGFSVALERAVNGRKAEAERLRKLRDNLQEQLTSAYSNVIISGDQKRRLPGHLHVSFPGLDAERLIFLLEMENVLLATGSACAANKGTRSHVLTAIGMSDEGADGSLRISLGHLSDEVTVRQGGEAIIRAVAKERERMGR